MQVIADKVQREETGGRIRRLGYVLFIAGVIAAIAAFEYIFAYQNVAYGISLALALAIVIYLALSLFRFSREITDVSESLVLLPLYVLFTASLPWFFLNQQYLLPAVYSCVLGLCFWYVYQKNLSLKEIFGFSKKTLLRYSLIGLMLGIPLGIGEYFVLQPVPAFPAFAVKYLLRDTVYMLGFVAIGEELLFRGLIQRSLSSAFGWKWGVFIASLLFAVMHLTWRSIPELIFVFVAGLIFGILYYRTKSLVAPIVAHGVTNVVLVSVLPYLLG